VSAEPVLGAAQGKAKMPQKACIADGGDRTNSRAE